MTLEVTHIGASGAAGPAGPQGLAFHCAGVPDANEVIGGGIAPAAITLSAVNSKCKAGVAATAITVLTIKEADVSIGTITFAAAGTVGVVAFSDAAIAADALVTIHNAATPDVTLANITGLLRA